MGFISESVLGWIGLAVVAAGAGAYIVGFIVRRRSPRWLATIDLACGLVALALLASDMAAKVHDPRVIRLVTVLLCVTTLAQARAALVDRKDAKPE